MSLWDEGDELIKWAIQMIEEAPYLSDQLEIIETYMDCVQAVRKFCRKSDRHTALVGLFIRTFDNLGHGLRASFSGNYSGCAMYARDSIETSFLLDYLMDQEGRPEQWLNSSQEEIRKNFNTAEIRKYLDERDGFTEQKRKQHFQMLSTLGAHPTPQAFALRKDGSNLINCGPFKHKELLIECVQETAKCALLLTDKIRRFSSEIADGPEITSSLSIVQQRIYETYFNK
jgi:hypothetical protein